MPTLFFPPRSKIFLCITKKKKICNFPFFLAFIVNSSRVLTINCLLGDETNTQCFVFCHNEYVTRKLPPKNWLSCSLLLVVKLVFCIVQFVQIILVSFILNFKQNLFICVTNVFASMLLAGGTIFWNSSEWSLE